MGPWIASRTRTPPLLADTDKHDGGSSPLVRAFVLLVTALILAGCGSRTQEPADTPTPTPTEPPTPTRATPTAPTTPPPARIATLGVALSPKSFSDEDFPRFFTEAKHVGSLVLWGGAADELGNASSAAHVVAVLSGRNDLAFAVQVGYHKEGAPFDEARRTRALDDAITFASAYKPEFFILGVELDRVHDKDPAFFDDFVPWYLEAYDAIKNVSPRTLVFPTFQLERTMGMTGGLYGEAESRPAKWDLVERFTKRDMTAFTTYPGYIFRNVDDIPADHYLALSERFRGPIGFTEVGYNAELAVPTFETSPEEQAAFVRRFLADAAKLGSELAVWLHLYDQPVSFAQAEHLGLLDRDGAERPAYDLWRGASS